MPIDQQSVHRRTKADSQSRAISVFAVHTDIGGLSGFSRDIPYFPQGIIHMAVQQAALSKRVIPKAAMWTVPGELRRRRLPEGKSHGLLP